MFNLIKYSVMGTIVDYGFLWRNLDKNPKFKKCILYIRDEIKKRLVIDYFLTNYPVNHRISIDKLYSDFCNFFLDKVYMEMVVGKSPHTYSDRKLFSHLRENPTYKNDFIKWVFEWAQSTDKVIFYKKRYYPIKIKGIFYNQYDLVKTAKQLQTHSDKVLILLSKGDLKCI